jgi:hypothetical protein
MTKTRNKMTILAIGTAMLFGGMTSSAIAESDVYWSVRSSTCAPSYTSTAGILTIDGRRFTIRSTRNIGREIVNAFRRQGYEASCVNGRVVVCYDPYCPPKVRWYQRGYSASFERWDGRMEICWSKYRGSGYTYRTNHRDTHWYNDRYQRPQRRYVRRGRCN